MSNANSNTYVVLIGSTKTFDPSIPPIPNVLINIKELIEVLSNSEISDVPLGNIIDIVDKTKRDTLIQIDEILNNLRLDDYLIIYYAGHGVLSSKNFHLYLSCLDSQKDKIELTWIKAEEIAEFVKDCRPIKKVFIIDSCYSGAILGVMTPINSSVTSEINRSNYEGVYTIVSAGENQQAKFDHENPLIPTYFTQAIINVLRNGVSVKQEYITTDTLFKEIRAILVADKFPRPIKKVSDDGNEFIIAKNIKYDASKYKSELNPIPQRKIISNSSVDEDSIDNSIMAVLKKFFWNSKTLLIFIVVSIILSGLLFMNSKRNKTIYISTADALQLTTKIHAILYKIELNSPLEKVIANEWSSNEIDSFPYEKLYVADECVDSDVKYVTRRLEKSIVDSEFSYFLEDNNLIDKIQKKMAYVAYFFKDRKLIRIGLRYYFKSDNNSKTDSLLVSALLRGTKIPYQNRFKIKMHNIYYIIGPSSVDTDLFEINICNERGYNICIHDWWHNIGEDAYNEKVE